ncbi:radical SAM protein [Campylobacter pinnipediorum]|uniref:radical SAM protein n=1 Tax=Campylobacter pinnipediorum TaxID=1965231 RepID=UPI00084CF188|nr:radical SAM protein [Campylobacter pinnipediorum]
MFEKRIKSHHSGHPKRSKYSDEDELFEFLDTNFPKQKDGVLYFHTPFCDNICSFCSMNRSRIEDELDEYCKYILEQIDLYAKFAYIRGKVFESVYFGGGTPTIFKERHLEKILSAINDKFNLSNTCEFNFESTLHNLNLSKLKLMQDFGVNRFSIGIQTFSQRGRELLNRVHTKEAAISHLEKIRANFDKLLCADIIYNYPDQTEQEVREDAKILKNIGIDSSSFYSLIFFEGSEFAKTHTEDYYDLQTDKMLHNAFVDEMFKGGDYEFLELTKINKKDRDSYKYIKLTHLGVDILPLGIGAGGKLDDFGIFNMKKNLKMVRILPQQEINYRNFTALFQYPKVKFDDLKKYISEDGFLELLNFFKKCEENKLLNISENGYELNVDGVFWGNTISEEVSKIIQKEFE